MLIRVNQAVHVFSLIAFLCLGHLHRETLLKPWVALAVRTPYGLDVHSRLEMGCSWESTGDKGSHTLGKYIFICHIMAKQAPFSQTIPRHTRW